MIQNRILLPLYFFGLAYALNVLAADQVLELRPIPTTVWEENWAGGCWFQKEFRPQGSGGELMFLIRGEGKDSIAVFDLDGKLWKLPYVRTVSKSKRIQLGARESYLYGSQGLRVLVTTIVTEVPRENECAGDCAESSGFAAELYFQAGKAERKYKFNNGACGL